MVIVENELKEIIFPKSDLLSKEAGRRSLSICTKILNTQFNAVQLKQKLSYSVFQSAEVQKLWVLGKRQEAKGKGEEKQVYLTSLGNAIYLPILEMILNPLRIGYL
ncbi:hypothetical protein NIES3804_23210 [Microcystis aeruginosa NIES-3804]|uniref:Uncharacterized protein n=1 Tax=Microcystis aeruginosa NIES-3804 TaxID=2517783 RepID=A0A6H9G6G5_MICAE|nr:hypothetical protein [Microcystis aeruginosa]GCL50751.1 hypothetical protein NIES3804_23210 [Microcystis aeruginosa NIES-3804]